MLLFGVGSTVITEVYSAVMQRCFQHSDNKVGKGFAILGIYLVAVFYCECTQGLPIRGILMLCENRQLSEQYHLALRSRSSAHVYPKQSNGCSSCIALHSQCGPYVQFGVNRSYL